MTSRALAFTMLVAAAGCGEAPPQLAPSLHVDAALHDITESVALFVYGPQRSDDILLTCSTLLASNPDLRLEPGDERLDQLGTVQVALSGGNEIQVDEVPAGEGRVVFVQALDANGDVVGHGCAENIVVASGRTTDRVDVTVYPLP